MSKEMNIDELKIQAFDLLQEIDKEQKKINKLKEDYLNLTNTIKRMESKDGSTNSNTN